MRIGIGLVFLIALTGCIKQSEREEQKLEIVKKGRDNVAICDQTKRVADTYLGEADEQGYQKWKTYADVSCMTAADEPFNMSGIDVSSDNMTALLN